MDQFPSPAAMWAFWIITVAWLLGEWIGVSVIPNRKRGGSAVQGMNRVLNFLTIMSVVIVFGVALWFPQRGLAMLPGWVCYIGITLMLLGVVVRQWAIAVLGRYFSAAVGIQKGHKVVVTGPYRLVRHPSFTGVLLTETGIGLALQSWGAVMIIVVLFGLVYGYRMLAEEKVLLSELGKDYADYMKRTKRLIPFLV